MFVDLQEHVMPARSRSDSHLGLVGEEAIALLAEGPEQAFHVGRLAFLRVEILAQHALHIPPGGHLIGQSACSFPIPIPQSHLEQ